MPEVSAVESVPAHFSAFVETIHESPFPPSRIGKGQGVRSPFNRQFYNFILTPPHPSPLILHVPRISALVLATGLLADSFPPPELQLRTLKKEPAKLSDYRGKIVVLNFWATWCVPCRKEMPLFVELQNEYAARGVQFIAASTDPAKDRKKVEKFVRQYKINFPVWTGATPDDQDGLELGTLLPATAVFDANGKRIFRIVGEASREVLTERLDYLLTNRADSMPNELSLPPGMTEEHWEEHLLAMEEDEHEHEQHAREPGSEVPS